MSNLKWRFPLARGGNKSGISDSGIESFTGQRISSLTREIIQNSLDAKREDLVNDPVIVEFKTFNINSEGFPGKEDLLMSMEQALKESKHLKSNKTKNFYEVAINTLKSKKIKMLRISDFNTLGLEGVEEEDHSPWHYLVKSQGISDKDDTAGGSFGIGKNATFVVSNLRTVFYETLTISNHKGSEGVSNLISYRVEEEDDYTQGIGYYGIDEKNNPYRDFLNLDKSFLRDEPGTDIYVSGLIVDESFENNIIKSVLNSFMYAIYKNTLEVKVNDIVINKNTLINLITRDDLELDNTTKEMFLLLTDKNTHVFKENIIDTLTPDIEIRLLIEDDSSRKISMVRKPWMKITDFQGFPKAYQFSGMVIIKGDKLNELLRKIENPQHDDWQSERLTEHPEMKKQVDQALSQIRRTIARKLQDLHQTDLSDYLDIFGASEYLPQISEDSEFKTHEKVEDKTSSVVLIKKTAPISSNEVLSFEDGDSLIDLDGNELIEIIVNEDDNDHYKDNDREKIIDEIEKGRKVSLTKENYRIIVLNSIKGEYRIILNVVKEGNYNLKILLLDEQAKTINNYLMLLSAEKNNSELEISRDFIKNIKLIEGLNIIDVKTNINNYVSLGVLLYEI